PLAPPSAERLPLPPALPARLRALPGRAAAAQGDRARPRQRLPSQRRTRADHGLERAAPTCRGNRDMIMQRTIRLIAATALCTLSLRAEAAAERLVSGSATEPSAIDPHFSRTGNNQQIAVQLFGRLVD